MINQTELRLQQECFLFIWNNYPKYRGLFFKVKNEGTNRITGSIDKATGLIAGVSDMILLANKTAYFFEFKTEKGKQSQNQINWENKVTSEGYKYFIIRNVYNFKDIICQLGL